MSKTTRNYIGGAGTKWQTTVLHVIPNNCRRTERQTNRTKPWRIFLSTRQHQNLELERLTTQHVLETGKNICCLASLDSNYVIIIYRNKIVMWLRSRVSHMAIARPKEICGNIVYLLFFMLAYSVSADLLFNVFLLVFNLKIQNVSARQKLLTSALMYIRKAHVVNWASTFQPFLSCNSCQGWESLAEIMLPSQYRLCKSKFTTSDVNLTSYEVLLKVCFKQDPSTTTTKLQPRFLVMRYLPGNT